MNLKIASKSMNAVMMPAITRPVHNRERENSVEGARPGLTTIVESIHFLQNVAERF